MGRHEAKHFKQIERQLSGEVFLGRRGTHLFVSLLAIVLSMALLLYGFFALAQYVHYQQLARTKAHEHAKAAVALVNGADLYAGEDGAASISARLSPLFELSSCRAGDSVSWCVYTASGTQSSVAAGSSDVLPSQHDILTARSEGSSVSKKGTAYSAVAIVTYQGKIAGFVQVVVDYTAYKDAILSNYILLVIALSAGILVFAAVFMALGFVRRYKENEFEKVDAREGFRNVFRGYILRAFCVALVILVLCLIGVGPMDLLATPICSAEHEELLLQNAALRSAAVTLTYGADLDSARGSTLLEGFTCHDTDFVCAILPADQASIGGRIIQANSGGTVMLSQNGSSAWVPVYSGQEICAVFTVASASGLGRSFSLPLFAAMLLLAPAAGGVIYIIGVSGHDRRIRREQTMTEQAAGIGGAASE